MPQFDFAHVFWPQFVWLALAFAVLYFGVVRMTLPRLGRAVDARENQIAGDLRAAAQANDTATAVGAAYHRELEAARESARQAIAEGKGAAAKASETALAAATAKADAALAAAEARIATAVAAARDALDDAAAESAQAVVKRLTGREPSAAEAKAALAATDAA